MNCIQTATNPQSHREFNRLRSFTLALACLVCATGTLATLGCSSDKGDTEPVVTVQVAPVEKTTIQRTINAQAVLFPHQQAAIVPKISAPVQKFLVKRGSAVHEGELLAVLENRDLSAAAQDTKGSYDQAQAAYETTTKRVCRKRSRKRRPMRNRRNRRWMRRRKYSRAASNSSIRVRCHARNSTNHGSM